MATIDESEEAFDGVGVDLKDARVVLIDKQLARDPSPWIVNSGFHGRRLSRPVKK